jgi:hypothetical protein
VTVQCPECGGRQVPNTPEKFGGYGLFDHRRTGPECSLGRREDATMAADSARGTGTFGPVGPVVTLKFTRAVTAAEVTLLAAAGLPAATTVEVDMITRGARRRTFT